MSRRNANCGGCNACCPTCELIFTVETCTLSWNCESCCGTDWEDNQHYILVALNGDSTVYADYGDVGKSGAIIPIFGKTYRLTVQGPDCVANRVYYRVVPEDACPCTFTCYPSSSVATMTVSGFANSPGVWLGPSLGGTYRRDRYDLTPINHTRAFSVQIGDTFGCPHSYIAGERYLIGEVTTYSDYSGGSVSPSGVTVTAYARWKVYGYYDYTDPPLAGFYQPSFPEWNTPAYRLSMILQEYNSIRVFGFSSFQYLAAVPLRGDSIPLTYAVGDNGYRVNSLHPAGSYFARSTHPAWCDQRKLDGRFEALTGGFFQWSPPL